MCSRLAMRQFAICSRSGMNFAHTVNASCMSGFAALLVVGGGFAGEGRENKTKQRQPEHRPKTCTRKARAKSATNPGAAESAHVPATAKASPMLSATARFDGQSAGESGWIS
jgi:hypothetical protein